MLSLVALSFPAAQAKSPQVLHLLFLYKKIVQEINFVLKTYFLLKGSECEIFYANKCYSIWGEFVVLKIDSGQFVLLAYDQWALKNV